MVHAVSLDVLFVVDQPFSHRAMGNSRRLKRAMRATRSRGHIGSSALGGVKMSEVLLDFAEPLVGGLSLPDDRAAFVAAIKIASLLWNEAVCPGQGGSEELYARLSDGMGTPRDPEMEKIFDAMIVRGRLLYPHLDRIVASVHVTVDDDGRCTVRVLSEV
jgi:hypothetical protein